MSNLFVFRNLRSHYCKIVFLVSLIAGYFLIPREVITGKFSVLALAFIISFSLTISCIARTVKEQIKTSISVGSSVVGVLTSIVGITALQVCGLGVPACGASIGAGAISIFFPGFVFNYFREYSVLILTATILIQIYSLYKMKCFTKNLHNY